MIEQQGHEKDGEKVATDQQQALTADQDAPATKFANTGSLPPVATQSQGGEQQQSASDRAFDDRDSQRAAQDAAAIRSQLFQMMRSADRPAPDGSTSQAVPVGETPTAHLFIQHVYIRNYNAGGFSEVLGQNILTAPQTDGKKNVVGVVVHWQKENPQVPGTFYENGNQAVVAPALGQTGGVTRYSGEQEELFVLEQGADNPAPQFALKSNDMGGYIGDPQGGLNLFESADQMKEVTAQREGAKEAKKEDTEQQHDAALEAGVSNLSTESTVVVRERDGRLQVDPSVSVKKGQSVRVINATGRRLNIHTSQLDAGSLNAPHYISSTTASVDHGDFMFGRDGFIDIEGERVSVQMA